MSGFLQLGEVPADSKAMVIGIDFGTACSGVAYAYKADLLNMKYCAPGAKDTTETKVPTVIMVHDSGTWEFGHAAEVKYNELLMGKEDGRPVPAQLFRKFKMELKDKSSGMDTLTAKSVAGVERNLMDLVVKSITKLKDAALEQAAVGYGIAANPKKDVQWVLTVPAIWNDFGKAFMRKAAFKAGLVETEEADNLMLVLEPEGAALAVHVGATNHGILGTGSRFMVLDCGGGTVDITSYEVTCVSPHLSLRAIAIPTGGAWGSEYVTAEFEKFLQEFLGPRLYKPHEAPFEFYAIVAEFNKHKLLFEPCAVPSAVRLIDVLEDKTQLEALAEAWNAKHPDKQVTINNTLKKGFLTMSKELMMSFYEPCLANTVRAVEGVLKEVENIKTIIVVGGFGCSKVLTERVNREFHMKKGVRVILAGPTPKPQGAIVQGAVFFGLYKNIIDARLSPYTYGVAMRLNNVDDCFQVLVSKGEQLAHGHQVYAHGLPIHEWPQQQQISWRFYRTHLPEPTTVTDEKNVVLVGTLTVPCPHAPRQIDRKQTVWLEFGGPEISAYGENAQKQQYKILLDVK